VYIYVRVYVYIAFGLTPTHSAYLVAAGHLYSFFPRIRACLKQRDEEERQWLTALRSILNGLRKRSQEVSEYIYRYVYGCIYKERKRESESGKGYIDR